MAIFCKLLMAQRAFIETLQSQIIELKNGGQIKSENYKENKSGFIIKSNGDAEFNQALFRGNIDATGGKINNVLIAREALFEGSINSGPLFASNEIITPPNGTTFQSNTTISVIKSALNVGTIAEGGSKSLNLSGGSFGSKTGLSQLVFDSILLYKYQYGWNTGIIKSVYGLKLTIKFNDNTTYTFQDTVNNQQVITEGKINQSLTVGGGTAGQTLRFHNLPTGAGNYPAGTVYRNGNQLMIV